MLSFCATVVAVVLSSLTNSVNGEEATCGQCLPIMEGSDAIIQATLYKTTVDPKEYVKAVDETFTSIQRNSPGFISIAAAATDDPSVFLFYNIFDSEENSYANWQAVTAVEDFEFDSESELLSEYVGTVTWTGAANDCADGGDVGKYLASRHYEMKPDRPVSVATVSVDQNYELWLDNPGFDYYLRSSGREGNYGNHSFYINVFDTEQDSRDANELGLSSTTLDASIWPITSTVGKILFDHTCAAEKEDVVVADDDDDDNEDTNDVTVFTCDECLPINEGDNAYINARLWESNEDPEEYLRITEETVSPIFMNSPGFISYAAAKTANPSVFLFWDIFESKDASDAARAAFSEAVDPLELDTELIVEYEGTIFWSGSTDDCINGNNVGKFVAMRMYEIEYAVVIASNAPSLFVEWTEMDSFGYYLNTRGSSTVTTEDGHMSTLYMNVFDNIEDTQESNVSGLMGSNDNANTKLLTTTVGEIVFDHTCADDNSNDDYYNDDGTDDDDDEEKCMTIDELVCGDDAEDYTTLCDLLTTFSPDIGAGDDSITIFAPTNEAFDNASKLLDESNLSDEQMYDIFMFHAMEGKYLSTDLVCSETYTMLSGDDSRFVCRKGDNTFYQRGGGNTRSGIGIPKIIEANIIACNDSVIHIVDQVLLPNKF